MLASTVCFQHFSIWSCLNPLQPVYGPAYQSFCVISQPTVSSCPLSLLSTTRPFLFWTDMFLVRPGEGGFLRRVALAGFGFKGLLPRTGYVMCFLKWGTYLFGLGSITQKPSAAGILWCVFLIILYGYLIIFYGACSSLYYQSASSSRIYFVSADLSLWQSFC